MAKHKAHVPWWRLRRRLRDALVDLHQLEAQHRKLSRRWSEDRRELDRLKATYEPEIVMVDPAQAPVPVEDLPPGTSWGAKNAAASALAPAWDPDATTMIPVVMVGVDPSRTDPAGITVVAVDSDGVTKVISDES